MFDTQRNGKPRLRERKLRLFERKSSDPSKPESTTVDVAIEWNPSREFICFPDGKGGPVTVPSKPQVQRPSPKLVEGVSKGKHESFLAGCKITSATEIGHEWGLEGSIILYDPKDPPNNSVEYVYVTDHLREDSETRRNVMADPKSNLFFITLKDDTLPTFHFWQDVEKNGNPGEAGSFDWAGYMDECASRRASLAPQDQDGAVLLGPALHRFAGFIDDKDDESDDPPKEPRGQKRSVNFWDSAFDVEGIPTKTRGQKRSVSFWDSAFDDDDEDEDIPTERRTQERSVSFWDGAFDDDELEQAFDKHHMHKLKPTPDTVLISDDDLFDSAFDSDFSLSSISVKPLHRPPFGFRNIFQSSSYYVCPPEHWNYPGEETERLAREFEENLRIEGLEDTLESFGIYTGPENRMLTGPHFGGRSAPTAPPKGNWPTDRAVETVAYKLALASKDSGPMIPLRGDEPWTRNDEVGFWNEDADGPVNVNERLPNIPVTTNVTNVTDSERKRPIPAIDRVTTSNKKIRLDPNIFSDSTSTQPPLAPHLADPRGPWGRTLGGFTLPNTNPLSLAGANPFEVKDVPKPNVNPPSVDGANIFGVRDVPAPKVNPLPFQDTNIFGVKDVPGPTVNPFGGKKVSHTSKIPFEISNKPFRPTTLKFVRRESNPLSDENLSRPGHNPFEVEIAHKLTRPITGTFKPTKFSRHESNPLSFEKLKLPGYNPFELGGVKHRKAGLVDENLHFRAFDGDYTMTDAPPLHRVRSSRDRQFMGTREDTDEDEFDVLGEEEDDLGIEEEDDSSMELEEEDESSEKEEDLDEHDSDEDDSDWSWPSQDTEGYDEMIGTDPNYILPIHLYDGTPGDEPLPDTTRPHRTWTWYRALGNRTQAMRTFWQAVDELLGTALGPPRYLVEVRTYGETGRHCWSSFLSRTETTARQFRTTLDGHTPPRVQDNRQGPASLDIYVAPVHPALHGRITLPSWSLQEPSWRPEFVGPMHRVGGRRLGESFSGPWRTVDCFTCGALIKSPAKYAKHYIAHFQGTTGRAVDSHPAVHNELIRLGWNPTCRTCGLELRHLTRDEYKTHFDRHQTDKPTTRHVSAASDVRKMVCVCCGTLLLDWSMEEKKKHYREHAANHGIVNSGDAWWDLADVDADADSASSESDEDFRNLEKIEQGVKELRAMWNSGKYSEPFYKPTKGFLRSTSVPPPPRHSLFPPARDRPGSSDDNEFDRSMEHDATQPHWQHRRAPSTMRASSAPPGPRRIRTAEELHSRLSADAQQARYGDALHRPGKWNPIQRLILDKRAKSRAHAEIRNDVRIAELERRKQINRDLVATGEAPLQREPLTDEVVDELIARQGGLPSLPKYPGSVSTSRTIYEERADALTQRSRALQEERRRLERTGTAFDPAGLPVAADSNPELIARYRYANRRTDRERDILRAAMAYVQQMKRQRHPGAADMERSLHQLLEFYEENQRRRLQGVEELVDPPYAVAVLEAEARARVEEPRLPGETDALFEARRERRRREFERARTERGDPFGPARDGPVNFFRRRGRRDGDGDGDGGAGRYRGNRFSSRGVCITRTSEEHAEERAGGPRGNCFPNGFSGDRGSNRFPGGCIPPTAEERAEELAEERYGRDRNSRRGPICMLTPEQVAGRDRNNRFLFPGGCVPRTAEERAARDRDNRFIFPGSGCSIWPSRSRARDNNFFANRCNLDCYTNRRDGGIPPFQHQRGLARNNSFNSDNHSVYMCGGFPRANNRDTYGVPSEEDSDSDSDSDNDNPFTDDPSPLHRRSALLRFLCGSDSDTNTNTSSAHSRHRDRAIHTSRTQPYPAHDMAAARARELEIRAAITSHLARTHQPPLSFPPITSSHIAARSASIAAARAGRSDDAIAREEARLLRNADALVKAEEHRFRRLRSPGPGDELRWRWHVRQHERFREERVFGGAAMRAQGSQWEAGDWDAFWYGERVKEPVGGLEGEGRRCGVERVRWRRRAAEREWERRVPGWFGGARRGMLFDEGVEPVGGRRPEEGGTRRRRRRGEEPRRHGGGGHGASGRTAGGRRHGGGGGGGGALHPQPPGHFHPYARDSTAPPSLHRVAATLAGEADEIPDGFKRDVEEGRPAAEIERAWQGEIGSSRALARFWARTKRALVLDEELRTRESLTSVPAPAPAPTAVEEDEEDHDPLWGMSGVLGEVVDGEFALILDSCVALC